MTIDERLDRLTERHEALTQTVEHMALQGEEQNKRIQLQTANIDRIMNVVERIAVVAENHERRISRLEGQPDNA